MKILQRFSVRDLLWLTVVVSLSVGWWEHSRRADNRSREQYEALQIEFFKLLHENLEMSTALSNSEYEVVHQGVPRIAKKKPEAE